MLTGQGTWPAIWMLPTAQAMAAGLHPARLTLWKRSISALAVNNMTMALKTARMAGPGGEWPVTRAGGSTHLDDINAFHTYTLEWYRDEMRWWLTVRNMCAVQPQWRSDAAPGNAYAPFDERFHLILIWR